MPAANSEKRRLQDIVWTGMAARLARERTSVDLIRGSRYDWRARARPNQIAPPDDYCARCKSRRHFILRMDPTTGTDRLFCEVCGAPPWLVWLLRFGRGGGKTRSAAEWCREQIYEGGRRQGAFLCSTHKQTEKVMIINPKSGILAICPPAQRPEWLSSKHELRFPNGAIVTTYSAEQPEDLRGPEHDFAWPDEPDAWAYAGAKSSPEKAITAWDNLLLGCRLTSPNGRPPQIAASSTPKRGRIVAKLTARAARDGDVVIATGHTRENAANLDPQWLAAVIRQYEGGPLGRQELGGELLEEIEGALFKQADFDRTRIRPALGQTRPDLERALVAVDPGGTRKSGRSETGIVAGGRAAGGHGYLTHDWSGRFAPEEWATRAVELYTITGADAIVAERNFGGDMVEGTIRAVARGVNVVQVNASRGKVVRAGPLEPFVRHGEIHHVGDLTGDHGAESPYAILEAQLCGMTEQGYKGGLGEDESPSPDRADAWVWLFTAALLGDVEALGIVVPSAR